MGDFSLNKQVCLYTNTACQYYAQFEIGQITYIFSKPSPILLLRPSADHFVELVFGDALNAQLDGLLVFRRAGIRRVRDEVIHAFLQRFGQRRAAGRQTFFQLVAADKGFQFARTSSMKHHRTNRTSTRWWQ